MTNLDTLHAAMVDADAAFSAALEREYGARAGDVRYCPAEQSEAIRALATTYLHAAEAWRAAYRRALYPGIARP